MSKDIALPVSVYVLCVVLVSLLWDRQVVLLACYLAVSVSMLYQWHAPSDVAFYGIAFLLGPLGEIAAVHSGAWQYSEPLYLIPIWLPFLWGIVGLFLKRVSEAFAGVLERKGDSRV